MRPKSAVFGTFFGDFTKRHDTIRHLRTTALLKKVTIFDSFILPKTVTTSLKILGIVIVKVPENTLLIVCSTNILIGGEVGIPAGCHHRVP
jgi:hypothetical protein